MKKILLSVFVLSILLPTLAFASFDTSLKYGSRGDAVLELQDLLQAQGFLKSKGDGRYGLVTLKAVKSFQSANGLSSDGYFGKASRAKASSILSEQLQSSNTAEQIDTGTITPATSTIAGCTSTSLYSPTTGQPCNSTTQPTTPNLPAGCTSTSGFSITTGQACNGVATTVQQIQQTVQQIQQNTQQIAQNTTPTDVCPNISGNQSYLPPGMILQNGNCITPTPTPETDYPGAPTPTTLQASIKILETIGNSDVDATHNTNLTARKGFDSINFAIKSFDAQGKQIDSDITVTNNDPDLPPTFTIKANMAFYIGKHIDDNNIQGSSINCTGNAVCLPQSVGTFNFTFTNPTLNVSKSTQVTVVDYAPVVPIVTVNSSYNAGTFLVSNLNNNLLQSGFIYGNTTLFSISPQYNTADPFMWSNLHYSITSTDFQPSDIILICGSGTGGAGGFLLSPNGDVARSSGDITLNGNVSTHAYLNGCNSQYIGFGLENKNAPSLNIHPGSLTITVTDAKFVGGKSGNTYNATGLPITSGNIVIQ